MIGMKKIKLVGYLLLTLMILQTPSCAKIKAFFGKLSEGDKKTMTIMDGLNAEIIKEGTGEEITAGKTAVVHYTGWLENGTKFDSSLDRNQPFNFPVGAGRVIKGWDEGVKGMKVGEKRKLTIAPQLAYGERGAGSVIPPNSTLIFEVELLEIR